VRLNFIKSLGSILVILATGAIIGGATMVVAYLNSPPRLQKPSGIAAMEVRENLALDQLLSDVTPRYGTIEVETHPPVDSGAPAPAGTYLYNTLLDNLLSSLHYYFKMPAESEVTEFVASWDAETGERVLSDALLISLESNISYLLTLETYRKLHMIAIFDEDLEATRERVRELFDAEWHSRGEWPLGVYFDLIRLYEITENEDYLRWAERYAAGDGPEDTNTPLYRARELALRIQYDYPRTTSPFHFYHCALLADYGNRHDPTMLNQARIMFEGLREFLYDPRYKMLWKQVSTQGGSMNIIQTFDSLEQLSAIRAITEYGKISGDPDALSLTRALLDGVWGSESPMLITAPEPYSPTTYYGIYTAYDVDRSAERLDPNEQVIVEILLYEALVMVNEATRGEFRGDVDFLSSWLEDNGPLYRRYFNGYFTEYAPIWEDPLNPMISSKAAIWMSKGLVADEWYKYRTARALSISGVEE